MFRKTLRILIVVACLLYWGNNVFAYDFFFETINLDTGDGSFRSDFDNDVLLAFTMQGYQEAETPNVSFYDFLDCRELYNDGTNGDFVAYPVDDDYTYMCPHSAIGSGYATFRIDSTYAGDDTFYGNALIPAHVTAYVDELTWDSVVGASSYWVGIWDLGRSFYDHGDADEDKWVDFSNRVETFGSPDTPLSGTSISSLGLAEGQYTYGIFAMGDGLSGTDGWSAAKGTLTVTPEPASFLLFLLGGGSLIFSVNRRKKKAV